MRIVVALGGNALLRRGQPPDAQAQEVNIRQAVAAVATLAREHELLITHGNGPQVGLLALESEQDPVLDRPYPLDVIGAETEGMVGYWLEREFINALPGRRVAALLTQTVVSADDPAFRNPTKFVGATYDELTAQRLADERGWTVRRDGAAWRRVVPSPAPLDIIEFPIIRSLVDDGVLVICAGGGGVPVVREPNGQVRGVEAVVDKDRTAAMLAEIINADGLLMLTDVRGVERDYGTSAARLMRSATPHELRAMQFPAGSMGPKIDAACEFVEHGGRFAGIGSLSDAGGLVDGTAGTRIAARSEVVREAG